MARHVLGQVLKESFEEAVVEPIVGEWLLTVHSSLADGAGKNLGELGRGERQNYAGLVATWGSAVAKLGASIKTELLGQLKGALATLRNVQAFQQMREAYQVQREAGASWTSAAGGAFQAFLQMRLGAPEGMAQRVPRLLAQVAATAGAGSLVQLVVHGLRAQGPLTGDMTFSQLQRMLAASFSELDRSTVPGSALLKMNPQVMAAIAAHVALAAEAEGDYGGHAITVTLGKDTPGWEADQVTLDEAITQQVVEQFLALELTEADARAWLAEGNRLGQLRAGLQFAPQGMAFVEGNPLDGPAVAAYRLYGLEGAEPAATVALADVLRKLLKLPGRNIGKLLAEVNALKQGEQGPAGLTREDVQAVKFLVQHLEGDLQLELFEASGKVVPWAVLKAMSTDELGLALDNEWAGAALGVYDPPNLKPPLNEQELTKIRNIPGGNARLMECEQLIAKITELKVLSGKTQKQERTLVEKIRAYNALIAEFKAALSAITRGEKVTSISMDVFLKTGRKATEFDLLTVDIKGKTSLIEVKSSPEYETVTHLLKYHMDQWKILNQWFKGNIQLFSDTEGKIEIKPPDAIYYQFPFVVNPRLIKWLNHWGFFVYSGNF